MIYTTGILLETTAGELIFQHRDNIPTIRDPGLVSTFGGHSEPEDASPVECAARELEEETCLKFPNTRFKLLATFEMQPCLVSTTEHVFLVENVESKLIDLREGQAVVIISKIDDLTKIPLAPFSRYLINLYWGI